MLPFIIPQKTYLDTIIYGIIIFMWECKRHIKGRLCGTQNADTRKTCSVCHRSRTDKKRKRATTTAPLSMLGLTFGLLTVLNFDQAFQTATCKCTCGNIRFDARKVDLLSGRVKHCGSPVHQSDKKLSSLVPNKVGRWTMIKASKTPNQFLCQCDKGHQQLINQVDLIQHKNIDCSSCIESGLQVTNARYCKANHDLEIWGLTQNGSCKACLKNKSLLRDYGISLDEFVALWEFQGRKCAICQTDLDITTAAPDWQQGMRTEIDHNHAKGLPKRDAIRGLLCGGRWKGCNRRLGHIDDAIWLQAAADYISDPPAQQMTRESLPTVR